MKIKSIKNVHTRVTSKKKHQFCPLHLKKYLRVLDVISSLNCELEYRSDVSREQKMSDLEVVALGLTAEFMSIDSKNSLFK